LTEQVSSLIQHAVAPKVKDPGVPTISCIIGDHTIDKALLDLGAGVNLLPYSIYEQLGLGELKPTTVILQLVDRSVKKPRGIIEDVIIRVDRFYFPDPSRKFHNTFWTSKTWPVRTAQGSRSDVRVSDSVFESILGFLSL
jgi:hypothetical protein